MNLIPLAFNTHREAIRDKILYVILVFALLMISLSILMSFISLSQEDKIVMDMGLSSINIFGLLITIFVGTTLLHKEIERKTIFLLLPKPLRRSDFILGKYLGLCTTLFIITLAMSLTFYLVYWYTTRHFDQVLKILPVSGQAILFIYIELMLITAIAIFFSTFSSSVMSAIFTLGMYVIGHLTQDIVNFGKLSGNAIVEALTTIIYYILPDLERLNLKNQVMFGTELPTESLLTSLGYGFLYTTVLLILSIIIFESREF